MKALPLFPYFLEKRLTIPTSPFFHLLVNGFSVIREYGSTLYVWMAHAVPPTNTKFQPLLLPTQAGISYTNTHKHRTSYFKSTLTFMGPAKRWKGLSAASQKREILAILHHSNNFMIFYLYQLIRDSSTLHAEMLTKFISIGSYSPEVSVLVLLLCLLKCLAL